MPRVRSASSVKVLFLAFFTLLAGFELSNDSSIAACNETKDPDCDGVWTSQGDNCPTVYNPGQEDGDDDGTGLACDTCHDPDFDGRGHPGATTCPLDNCPVLYKSELTPKHANVICRFSPGTVEPGYNVFDGSSGEWVDNVLTFGGHSDSGLDLDGEEIIVLDNSGAQDYCADTDGPCPPGCSPGIEKVKIQTGERTCLITWAHAAPSGGPWFGKSVHVSINNDDGHPWALISTNDFPPDIATPSTRSLNPPAEWEDLWGNYFNELLIVRLDGGNLHRLAHHRSRDVPNRYWQLPRASLSRDGRHVLFDSNFAQQNGVPDYTDVYLIDTLLPPVPPPPPCGPCIVEYCSTGNRCLFTSTCGPGGCCNYSCVADPECTLTEIPPNACGQF